MAGRELRIAALRWNPSRSAAREPGRGVTTLRERASEKNLPLGVA